jgi:serine carboxypeptidase-like clade 2
LTENGPFRPDENLNLVPNADSWNNFANVLYLESPAFVGFSFSKRAADRTVGDLRTAQDAYEAIQVFLDRFPQYRSHNFTVTGESYCGHYGVQLVDQIVQNNAKVSDDRKINLVGYFVGNPWMEPSTGQAAMPITWHEHQVISDTTFEGIMTKCDFTKSVPPNTGSECDQLYQTASNEMGNINVYSLYEDQCLSATQKHFLKHLGGMFDHFGGEPAPQPAPPCVDNWTEAYMNRLDVQKALHVVNPGSVKWAECTTLNYSMADLMTSVAPLYAKYMMMPGLRTAILSGDVDSVCPTSGTKVQLEQLLKFPVVKAWHPYTVNGQTAGYVTEYPNSAKLVTVRNSGHMIPSSQSARSAYIIEKLVTGQDF